MKRLSKKLVTMCGIGLCAMTLAVTLDMPVYASEGTPAEVSEDEGRSTNLTWYYKEFDGVMMMRLYNHTTGEWETDWIPAVG